MNLEIRYALITVAGFVIALVFTPLGGWLGQHWHIVALPGGRRHHHGAISKLGGIGIAAGFYGALALSQLISIPTEDVNESRRFWGLIIGGALLFVVGLLILSLFNLSEDFHKIWNNISEIGDGDDPNKISFIFDNREFFYLIYTH